MRSGNSERTRAKYPAFSLLMNGAQRSAMLVFRTSSDQTDAFIDVNLTTSILVLSASSIFDGGEHEVHHGIAQAAAYIMLEYGMLFALKAIIAAGWKLDLTGHSLGGGVAAIATAMMLADDTFSEAFEGGRIRTVVFSTPACVDKALSLKLRGRVTGVVTRNDLVPRLTVQNVQDLAIRSLAREPLKWMEQSLRADYDSMFAYFNLRAAAESTAGAEGAEGGDALAELHKQNSAPELSPTEQLLAELVVGQRVSITPLVGMIMSSVEGSDEVENCVRGSVRWKGKLQHDGLEETYVLVEFDIIMSDILQGEHDEGLGPLEAGDGTILGVRPYECTPGKGVFFRSGTEENNGVHRLKLATLAEVVRTEKQQSTPGDIVLLLEADGVTSAVLADCEHPSLCRLNPTLTCISDHSMRPARDALFGLIRLRGAEGGDVPLQGRAQQGAKLEDGGWRPCSCCERDIAQVHIRKSEAQRAEATMTCCSCDKIVCVECAPAGDKVSDLSKAPVEAVAEMKFQTKRLPDLRLPMPELGSLEPRRICNRCRFTKENHA